MRILLITGSFPPMKCGVGDYTASLAEALGKLDNTKVAVLTDRKAGTSRSNSNVEIFPIAKGWKFLDLPQILRTIRTWEPHVVHIQYPTQGYGGRSLPWLLPTLLFLIRIPIVQTWHEFLPMGCHRWGLPIGSIGSSAIAIAPGGVIVVRPDYTSVISSWYRWLIQHKHFRYIPSAATIPRLSLSDEERAAIRQRFAPPHKSLVAYFGFIFPHKGVDLIFEIADPARHHVVLIGQFNYEDPYHKFIQDHAQQRPWTGSVTLAGFVSGEEASRILAAADAVVLPFRNGGGIWNTSIHGAIIHGTFVLTTSRDQHGYDPSLNIYFARPNDITDMRKALEAYIGHRNKRADIAQYANWDSIAEEHRSFYKTVCG